MSRTEIEKYDEFIAECDQLLKAGQASSVAVRLGQLSINRVPRQFLQPLAKICRRISLISRGLKLLHPVVRSENRQAEPATDSELCEYAVLLSRNGSVQEALQVLKQIKNPAAPEALLSAAYCSMAHWDYKTVTSLLEQLLQTTTDPYQKLIAQVNLASAYLATSKLDQAYTLSTETIALAKEAGASRLTANCLEIRGQVHFRKNDFAKSRADLQMASEILGGGPFYDQIFVRQWLATMEALETSNEEPLLKFRQEASDKHLWESVREADLYRLHVNFDQDLFDHLVIGTSMPSYRQRIFELLPNHSASDCYIIGAATAARFDLETGEMTSQNSLAIEPKLHHMIATLLQDFYVPRSIGSLFGELYPNEFFDVNSSPLRLRQLLFRTRKWLKANHLDAKILQTEGAYSLKVHGKLGIRIPKDRPSFSSESMKLQRLLRLFPPGTWFSAKEACEKLSSARTPFLLLAERGLSSGALIKAGVGRAIRYQFKQS